jgi:PAS domain S-box-containing protein
VNLPAEPEIWRALAEAAEEAVAIHEGGRVLAANPACIRMFGFSRLDEVIGLDGFAFVAPEMRADAARRVREGRTGPYESIGLRVDGSRFPVEFRVRPIELGGRQARAVCVRDLTEHNDAVAALRQSEERLRLATAATGLGIWDVNPVTGVRTWSDEFRAICGFAADQPADYAAFDALIHPEDGDWVRRRYAAASAGADGGWYNAEFRIFRADTGALVWVATTGRAVFDEVGRVDRVTGTLQDVTDRKRQEAALEERVAERTAELQAANRRLTLEIAERELTEAALLQAQKMEVVGQLTGGIAHDFNNLLAAILGNLDLLQQRQSTEPKNGKLIEAAIRATERGAKLTEQLLAFSRKKHLEKRPGDLNEIVTGMRDLLDRSLGGAIAIELALEDGLWPALVDANQTELMILNLAINARDAMPGGGVLTIATANVSAGAAEAPPDLRHADHVRLAVADTGLGMSEEVLAKALEPFFTTKPPGRGSGLGLSTVYGVVRQLGGDLRIASRPGEGTQVSLYLPRTAVPATEDPLDS